MSQAPHDFYALYPETIRELPHCDPHELRSLAKRYGTPNYRRVTILADEHLQTHRWRAESDRRGEVVFAIRQPNGGILLHTKHRYETPIFRLPTGGIHHGELVEEALFREVREETGQPVTIQSFVGLLDARFNGPGRSVAFLSYIFYLESETAELSALDQMEVAGYRTVAPENLDQVAQSLRSLGGHRQHWGHWRSLPHDVLHAYLTVGHHRRAT